MKKSLGNEPPKTIKLGGKQPEDPDSQKTTGQSVWRASLVKRDVT